jgi:hypothetical protein
MEYSKKGIDDSNNLKDTPIPNGMSGGLMTIHYKNSNGVLTNKAVGVIGELSRKKEAIVGISFDFISAFVERYNPELVGLKAEMEKRFQMPV